MPPEGRDPITPADVYVHAQVVGLPKWQGRARAARKKLEQMTEEMHFPHPAEPASQGAAWCPWEITQNQVRRVHLISEPRQVNANERCYNLEEVFENPQVQARGMRFDLDHPNGTRASHVANPLKFSETPLQYTKSAPMLGQHTQDVLRDVLGLDDDEIENLTASL